MQETERTPIWIMRQAGRYLPEYRAIRAKHDFLTMCKTPELASEVTVQPIDIIGTDAAILFSDILVIPEAMGMKLDVIESKGPIFDRPIRNAKDLDGLRPENIVERLDYVMQAIHMTKEKLAGRVPLIGFSGSPFTLACYMVEGSGSNDWRQLKTLLHARPELLHRILEVNARAITDYLNAQIEAGAQAVMIFDTWGGTLAHADFVPFSLNYSKQVLGNLRKESEGRRVPSILFTKGGSPWLTAMLGSGSDAIGLDWTADARQARALAAGRVALQGNLDPTALFAPAPSVRAAARRVLDEFGCAPGHVFNLGHGIAQRTPIESVQALVDEVLTYSRTRG